MIELRELAKFVINIAVQKGSHADTKAGGLQGHDTMEKGSKELKHQKNISDNSIPESPIMFFKLNNIVLSNNLFKDFCSYVKENKIN